MVHRLPQLPVMHSFSRLRGTSASVKRETETAPTTTVTDVTDVADVTFANEGAEEARVEILKEETALTYKYGRDSPTA